MCRANGVDENGNFQYGRRCPGCRGAAARRKQRERYQRSKARKKRAETFDKPHTEMFDGDAAPAPETVAYDTLSDPDVQALADELADTAPVSYADLSKMSNEELDSVINRNRAAYDALAARQAVSWHELGAGEDWNDVSRQARDAAAENDNKNAYLKSVSDTGKRVLESAEARLIKKIREGDYDFDDEKLYADTEQAHVDAGAKARSEAGLDKGVEALGEAEVDIDGKRVSMLEAFSGDYATWGTDPEPEELAKLFKHIDKPILLDPSGTEYKPRIERFVERGHAAATSGDLSYFENDSERRDIWMAVGWMARSVTNNSLEEHDRRRGTYEAKRAINKRDREIHAMRAEILLDEVQKTYADNKWSGGSVIASHTKSGKAKKIKDAVDGIAAELPHSLMHALRSEFPQLTTKITNGKRTVGYFSKKYMTTASDPARRIVNLNGGVDPLYDSEQRGVENPHQNFFAGLEEDSPEARQRMQQQVDEFNAQDDFSSADQKRSAVGRWRVDKEDKYELEVAVVEDTNGVKRVAARAVEPQVVKRDLSVPVIAVQPGDTNVVIHELTHGIDYSSPSFYAAGEQFLAVRTAGKGGKTSKEIADGFSRSYTGRIYEDGRATEVMTTGIEDLVASDSIGPLGAPWSPTSKYTSDPEHTSVVLGALAGANHVAAAQEAP